MKRRDEVEEGINASFVQRVKDLMHAQDGKLTGYDDVAEFRAVNSDPYTAILCRDDHPRARVRRSNI